MPNTCVAPDLRGYGGFSALAANDDYIHEQTCNTAAGLSNSLGSVPAIWVRLDRSKIVEALARKR